MGRPREHDEHTAQGLLDAAERLLAKDGPDAVSVRAVADAVGTATRAIYTVFGSKAGLIAALAARGYHLLADSVERQPASDDPVADLVAVGLHGFRPFALERPHLFRLTFERAPASLADDSVVVEAGMAAYDTLAQRIRRAQDAGALPSGPTANIAFLLHALCQGLASSELSRKPPPTGVGFWRHAPDLDPEQLWTTALTALLAGLSPAPDQPAPTASTGR